MQHLLVRCVVSCQVSCKEGGRERDWSYCSLVMKALLLKFQIQGFAKNTIESFDICCQSFVSYSRAIESSAHSTSSVSADFRHRRTFNRYLSRPTRFHKYPKRLKWDLFPSWYHCKWQFLCKNQTWFHSNLVSWEHVWRRKIQNVL